MNRFLTLAAALLAAQAVHAERVIDNQSRTESFEVSTASPLLEIDNIWGDVRVSPGPAGEITVAIEERRSAPSQALFERSLEVMPLNVEADAETVSLVVGQRDGRWHRMDPCRGCRVDVDFEVRVPPGTRLDVSTVNDGKVVIDGIRGLVRAGNVNGPVTVSGATDCSKVESVNGAVQVSFAASPARDCSIETVNGDIGLQVPEGTGLNVTMDLYNGRLVSELPVDPMALPATVEHRERDGRHQYRIEQPAGVRIAGGGPTFTISSLNGDIRIQNP